MVPVPASRQNQQAVHLPVGLVFDTDVTSTAKVIYMALSYYADYSGTPDTAHVPQQTLAAALGMSLGTVARRISELVSAGWVSVDQRHDAITNATLVNRYVLRTS